MDKVYNHKDVEGRIYEKWENSGYFKPEINPKGKPYCIILPPPNANGALHFGHAMFTIEDILIRYHRMLGAAALWLPGTDHAGIETQFVFERKLKGQGKSRLDFDKDTLYKMIDEYVNTHRGGIENQLRSLGFSLDWSREKYTLDPDVIKLVYKTFKKMYDEGLVYRDFRLVNYCTFDGTSFSDLEVVNAEGEGTLYYIKFPIKDGGFVTIATTRPETLAGDVAVMVNPQDKRYKNLISKTVILPIADREIPIIEDSYVDMKFGTGAVKVTPSHDFNDYEVAKKHHLTFPPVIGVDGKMKNAKVLDGLYVKEARRKVIELLREKNLLEKEEKHKIVLRICYKCKNVLQPLPLEQWFVKVKPLVEKAIKAVKDGKIKITPKNFETIYFQWMENLRDWNISRQIVWGIRIPVWFCGGSGKASRKRMGFADHVVDQVLHGKTKTYRIHARDYMIGDKLIFENTKTKTVFGYGIITKIDRKKIGEVDLKDSKHFATYNNVDELLLAFKQYYPPEEKIDKDTTSIIYTYSFEPLNREIRKGGCGQIVISEEDPKTCPACKQKGLLVRDSDTFDTWFSSGQWPYVTLMSNSNSKFIRSASSGQKSKLNGETTDFEKFYPTSVMETGYDLLKVWVTRMVMLGLYITGDVPFKDVLFHGLVNDPYGKKMSKSKGNVINPLELVDQYGADAVRFALIYGNATGNDQALSYPKLDAARKFINKIWNMGRFISMNRTQNSKLKTQNLETGELLKLAKNENDKEMIKKVGRLVKKVTKDLDNYNFNYAAEALYEFVWHEFADKYIEDVKNRINESSFSILNSQFSILLKLLHPFMPFVTEEIYQRFNPPAGGGKAIMIDAWPTV